MAGIDLNIIQNALPDDLKSKGAQKLGELVLSKGVALQSQVTPTLEDIKNNLTSGCPPQPVLLSFIERRNNIVNTLNNLGTFIDKITIALTGIAGIVNLVLIAKATLRNTKTGLNIAKIVINQASKFIPSPPGVPGFITSTITDLSNAESSINDTVDKITFDDLGESKLKPLQDGVNSSIVYLAVASGIVKTIVTLLETIDAPLKKCMQEANIQQTLTEVSSEIVALTQIESTAQQTINNTTYQGFVLEIEEVDFSPTVKQRRAVAKNSQGIVMAQTPLSFTSNPQTLINELKLIISRNNLKAI
jgi:hypothetical protein